ncbi:MAG: VWA domain-containing protein [Acidobacteriota bacterium]
MLLSILLLVSAILNAQNQQNTGKSSDAKRDEFGSSLKKYEKRNKTPDPGTKNADKIQNDEEVHIDTDLIIADATVYNQAGNLIAGLKKEDFIILEDGVPQSIDVFAAGRNDSVDRWILLIIDNSTWFGPNLSAYIEGAKKMVDLLGTRDRMAIATAEIQLLQDFTDNKVLLKNRLDTLQLAKEHGTGNETDALLAALNELLETLQGQKIVIFQADGTQFAWLKPDQETPYPVSFDTLWNNGLRYMTGKKVIASYGFADLREAVERSQATIYPVIMGPRLYGASKKDQYEMVKNHMLELNRFYKWNSESNMPLIINRLLPYRTELMVAGQTGMFRLAELSGGYADYIEKPEDAMNVYLNILKVIDNRYLLGYYPKNEKKDGKRRTISIRIKDHPEFILRYRSHFYY